MLNNRELEKIAWQFAKLNALLPAKYGFMSLVVAKGIPSLRLQKNSSH